MTADRPYQIPTTLRQRAGYVRQRLTPHLKDADTAAQASALLERLQHAVEAKDEAALTQIEQEAEAYRYQRPRPLALRVSAIQHELDARTDGSEREYRQVIIRDLQRLYQMYREALPERFSASIARDWYEEWLHNPDNPLMTAQQGNPRYYVILDALERAHLLVTNEGLDVDTALREVGLVASHDSSQPRHTGDSSHDSSRNNAP